MAGGRKGRGYDGTLEDRAAFLRDNAPAVVAEKEEKIKRLRARITQLEKRVRAKKLECQALQRQVSGHCDRIAAQSELLSRAAQKKPPLPEEPPCPKT